MRMSLSCTKGFTRSYQVEMSLSFTLQRGCPARLTDLELGIPFLAVTTKTIDGVHPKPCKESLVGHVVDALFGNQSICLLMPNSSTKAVHVRSHLPRFCFGIILPSEAENRSGQEAAMPRQTWLRTAKAEADVRKWSDNVFRTPPFENGRTLLTCYNANWEPQSYVWVLCLFHARHCQFECCIHLST